MKNVKITFIYYFRLPINKPEPVTKHDNEAQTELHPIPSHIDPTYRWNEWDLKRDAIKLVSNNFVHHATTITDSSVHSNS
jgi:hypothetical protein